MKKRLKILHKKTLLIFLAIIMTVAPITQDVSVEAASDSIWVNNEALNFHDEGEPSIDGSYLNGIPCYEEYVKAVRYNNSGRPYIEERSDCIFNLEWADIGRIYNYVRPKLSENGAVLDSPRPAPVPSSNDIFTFRNIGSTTRLEVYRDALSRFGRKDNNRVEYEYNRDNPETLINSNGTPINISRAAFSLNGKWMIARIQGHTVVRVNLETLEVLSAVQMPTTASGNFNFAISNDGKYGFYGNMGTSFPGPSSTLVDFSTCNGVNGCGVRDIGQDLIEFGGFSGSQMPEFSEDGTVLSINGYDGSQMRRVAVVAPGYQYSGLDYLALGDSFASGEGDLEGEKYYLEGTDVLPSAQFLDGEKCHISKRSYPFLLAQKMNLSGSRFKSIACSGATTNDILGTKDYYGQKDRLKNDNERTLEDIEKMKREALDDFTSGRAPQIDFVEKYKPKVVSISVGGNDVDFESVIKKCLMPGTCDYVDGSSKRRSKAQEVQTLTYRLERVYKTIYEKSRNTKVYVMGYPKFVKKNGVCNLNVRFNEAEREFLDEGVRYINSVIQAAAQRAGVVYVDLEESLGEGILCGGDAENSMNGLTRGNDELQVLLGIVSNYYIPGIGNESYHPNQRGHAKMANAVWSATNSQGLLNYNYCPAPALNYCPDTQVGTPSIPGYFGPDHIPITPQRADIVEQWAQPGDIRNFKAPYLLKPNSNIELEVHSNPISLGTFTTDNRGEFSEDIEIPDSLESGVHTIHLKGTLLSDEEVHMYQTILIVGSEDDIDGDGINDDQQECYFVEPAGIDTDFDGIDDGCDGDIGEPQLYGVRNGDTGNGENEDWLYIERNTRAASVTGIQNDYDPDGDGWAIVGQSTTSADSGVPANFWVDEQNVPHVSMRHPETGCTQLTAATLTEVEQGQARGLLQEAANTNTCREEAPEYDSDWDGVPDNAQILYRVRGGDMDEAENPDDVYIERNVIAAEAQLGITDFSHNQNDWAIIGVSDGSSIQGTFGDIIIENDVPYVCVDYATNGRIVLTPESLDYVKQSDVRKLKIETGGNINCDT